MTSDEFNPELRSVFAATRQEPADDGFSAKLLLEMETHTAKKQRLRFLLGAGLPALMWMLTTFGGVGVLNTPLIPITADPNILIDMIAPLNTVATVLGMLALAGSFMLRRVLR